MWLKKIFSPDQPKHTTESLETNYELEEETIITSIHIDLLPDLRYKQHKDIPHNENIKFPLTFLHQTENILMQEINLFNAKIEEADEWKQINLLATDRQLIITPNIVENNGKRAGNYFSLSYGSIEKFEILSIKKKESERLKIIMKDNREILLKCVLGDLIKKLYEIFETFAFVKGVNKFYAYRFGSLNFNKEVEFKGWEIYNVKREFMRQGLLTESEGGLPLKYIDNRKGEFSQTYPEYLVIPSQITDVELRKCASFRTKERFPALTYILEYKENKYATLFRCSQNKVGVLYSRSKEDELLIQYIGNREGGFLNPGENGSKQKNCKIYDARGYYAALGNMFAGKGYEKEEFYTNCEIEWLNIPNIHAVRDSYQIMMSTKTQFPNLYAKCAQSGWYDYLYLILAGAKSISKDLLNGINVIVHCSDGWDRTSQLCALSQLMIDPYYRTIEGFAVLVEKDWRNFGHKFRSRLGQYNSVEYHPQEKSPIFIQFLDCVYQIMEQFPLSFEFNERMLEFLAEHLESNVFGTFLCNNFQEQKELKLEENTVSVWSEILENSLIFINPYYNSELGEFWLDVGTEPKYMTVWKSLFVGDGASNNTAYQIMRHELEMNQILQARYYNNAVEIEELKAKLEEESAMQK